MVGRLADRFGKLRAFRVAAPLSIVLLLVVTTLPRAGLAVVVAAVTSLMVVNAARFVVVMALVNGSAEPRRRGGFLSANSSVQQLATALGALVGGRIVVREGDGTFRHFELVGLISACATLLSLWLAGRLRPSLRRRPPRPPSRRRPRRSARRSALARPRNRRDVPRGIDAPPFGPGRGERAGPGFGGGDVINWQRVLDDRGRLDQTIVMRRESSACFLGRLEVAP